MRWRDWRVFSLVVLFVLLVLRVLVVLVVLVLVVLLVVLLAVLVVLFDAISALWQSAAAPAPVAQCRSSSDGVVLVAKRCRCSPSRIAGRQQVEGADLQLRRLGRERLLGCLLELMNSLLLTKPHAFTLWGRSVYLHFGPNV